MIRTPSAHLTEDRELADRGNMTIHMDDGSVDLGGRHRTVPSPFPLDKKDNEIEHAWLTTNHFKFFFVWSKFPIIRLPFFFLAWPLGPANGARRGFLGRSRETRLALQCNLTILGRGFGIAKNREGSLWSTDNW